MVTILWHILDQSKLTALRICVRWHTRADIVALAETQHRNTDLIENRIPIWL